MASNKKALWAGFIGIAFFGISFLTLGSILPSLRDALGLDLAQAASLAGILPLGVLGGSIVFGPWCDRFGYKTPFLTAATLVILGLLGISFFMSMDMLRLCVLLIGLGGGILNGGTNAIVAEASDDATRSSNIAILGVFYGIGAICMPLVLGFFKEIPYTVILRFAAAGLGLGLVFFAVLRFPAAKVKQGFPMKDALAMLKSPILLFFSFILFFQSALEGLCSNWTSTYLQESAHYAMEPQRALFVLTFVVVGITVCRLFLSVLFLHFSPYKVLWGTFGIMAVGFAFLSVGWSALAATFLIGLGLGATFPVIIASIGQQFKLLSGSAIGIAMVIALVGNTILNYVMRFIPIDRFPLYLLLLLALMIMLYRFTVKKFKLLNN